MKLKRFDEFVFEKRSHADTNVDKSFNEFLNDLLAKYNIDDIFVSFRETKDVTDINPNNQYDTPSGFYTYPLRSYKDRITNDISEHKFRKVFPYKSDLDYIYFFIPNNLDNVLDADTPKEKVIEYAEKIKTIFKQIVVGELCDDFILRLNNNSPTLRGKHNTHKLWYLIYNVAKELMTTQTFDSYTKTNTKPIIFNLICNKIGIYGFADYNGDGFIHTNEPKQAVFFKVKNLGKVFIYEHPKLNKEFLKDKYNKNISTDGMNYSNVNKVGEFFIIQNKKNEYTLMDKYGDLLFNGNIWFSSISLMITNNMIKVKSDYGKYSVIDKNGTLLGEGKQWFNNIFNPIENILVVQIADKDIYKVIKFENDILVNPIYDLNNKQLTFEYIASDVITCYINDMNYLKVKRDNKYSLLSTDTLELIGGGKRWFDNIGDFSGGFINCINYTPKEFYFMDTDGNLYDENKKLIE